MIRSKRRQRRRHAWWGSTNLAFSNTRSSTGVQYDSKHRGRRIGKVANPKLHIDIVVLLCVFNETTRSRFVKFCLTDFAYVEFRLIPRINLVRRRA